MLLSILICALIGSCFLAEADAALITVETKPISKALLADIHVSAFIISFTAVISNPNLLV